MSVIVIPFLTTLFLLTLLVTFMPQLSLRLPSVISSGAHRKAWTTRPNPIRSLYPPTKGDL